MPNFKEIVDNLPRQFTTALGETKTRISSRTKNIIFCGVGGSALPADLLTTLFASRELQFATKLQIHINRNFSLPKFVDKKWRGFFSSYSGNTAETLSCLAQAEKIGLREIVLLDHDGQLKHIAEEKGYPLVTIPDTNQPRLSYAYILGALLKILNDSGLIKLNIAELNADVEKCLSMKDKIETQGRVLAQKLVGKVPVIYSSNEWKALARVWKINFNENAKVPAFFNAFPELCHNEMQGWDNKMTRSFHAIILNDSSADKNINKSIDSFQKVLNDKLEITKIEMEAGSPLLKMLTCLWLGLYTSYHLALINKTEPAEVPLVAEFKSLLS
ncbi:MAG: bifunctional phosphoglucose/phosphomannose isomerase [Parcubacteria group bacterium]